MTLIDSFPCYTHAIPSTDVALLAITKTDLDNMLIMDRELGYKLLWAFTKTLSRRLPETNEKMAGFLAMSGGFKPFSIVLAGAEWYSDTAAVTTLF